MPDEFSVARLRAALRGLLYDAGVDSPHVEADWLLSHVLSVPRASLHAHPERLVSTDASARAIELSVRRAAGEPMAHLLGSALFCGLSFIASRDALIPRTETELLTERADAYAGTLPGDAVFADWCTGSGCIAVTLLVRNPSLRAHAIDASPAALRVAKQNAALHGVSDRIAFHECADPAAADIPERSLDLVITNPPYIPTPEIAGLEPQVRDYEPREALDGGPDGLTLVTRLLHTLPNYMKHGAPLYLETGGEAQVRSLEAGAVQFVQNLKLLESFEDHWGIRRFMLWRNSS